MSGDEATRIVMRERPRRAPEATRTAGSRVLILLGWTFLLVGLVDLTLLWIPARLGSVAWEFATVGRTLDALPMPALGLGLVTYGAARHPAASPGVLRRLAIAFAVLGVLFALLGVLHFTSALAVLSETPPEAVAGVRRVLIRHAAQAILYPLSFLTIGFVLWRGTS